VDKKTINYSIDKCKILYECKKETAQEVMNIMTSLLNVKCYKSSKITNCQYNYLYNTDDGSVAYIGVNPNWISSHNINCVVLEFNPNKIAPNELPVFYLLSTTVNKNMVKIMNFDLTADIFENYDSLRMLKRDKREYFCNIGTSSTETRYLGTTAKTGHIKLYNKAIEQKENFDWSRFEITIKNIDGLCSFETFKDSIKLPAIYRLKSQFEFDSFNDIERLVVESLIADTDRLYTIKDYKTRKKYEKLLSSCLDSVELDYKLMYETFYYFFYKML
jgi:hypothetical protein